MSNRRRHANVIPLASIVMWILVCAFVGGAGLGYVSLKNRLHAGADEIRNLERELEQVSMRITIVTGDISKNSSVDKLKQRYASDKSRLGGLVTITDGAVVLMDRPMTTLVDSDDLQQTANPTR
jgi:hypothetical protein